MESARLKNIIIIILALLNVCLLLSLSNWRTAEHAAQRQVTEQLVALFSADSIQLDPDIIPSKSPSYSWTLTRDTAQERSLAAFFLGKELTHTERSSETHTYGSTAGAALFQGSGAFGIASGLTPEDPLAFCESFCKEFGYSDLVSTLENGTGDVTATQYFDGQPVFNCTVTFSFGDGQLITVTGVHLPDNAMETTSGAEPLSAAAALSAFLTARRETGAVVSAVTDMYLCYELQSTTAIPMTLVPTWSIVTDTARYYVNSLTGNVTQN